MNLYQLTSEAKYIASLLEEGELTKEIESALIINQNELSEKSVNYGKVILNFASDVEAIDAEIKRLKAIKDQREKSIDKLKDAVKDAMLASGITSLDSPLFKISLRRSEAVEVDLVESLSNDFKVVKTTVTADKIAIKQAIKQGETITGARIVENFNLQIK